MAESCAVPELLNHGLTGSYLALAAPLELPDLEVSFGAQWPQLAQIHSHTYIRCLYRFLRFTTV